MTVRTISRVAAAALILISPLLFTACSDSVDADEVALDQATSMEIFSQLSTQIMLIAFSNATKAGEAVLHESVLDDITVDHTAPCDGGGSVHVSGTITSSEFDNDGNGTFGYDLRQKPNQCRIDTSNGTYTVDGDPEIRVTASIDYRAMQPVGTLEFGYQGGYKWSGPGGSGGCQVNLDYLFNYTTQQISMKGRMCGFNFDI